MRVPLPPRLLALAGAGAGAAVALHLARKVFAHSSGQPRTRSRMPAESAPTAAAVVHEFHSPSPVLSEAGSTPAGSSSNSKAVLSIGLVLMLASLLMTSAAGVAALRQQWDLAGALAAAWALALLSQVLQRHLASTSSTSTSISSIELVEADAQVELVDAEPAKLPGLTGTWIKDNAASDSMEPAMTLVHLNGITRTAVRLVKGVKITLDERHFEFSVFSVISWFKVTERYTLGQPCEHKRRDLRRGKSSNLARLTPWCSLIVECEWGAPHAGRGIDEFSLDDQGRMILQCKMLVGGETVEYRTVYRRKH